MVTAWSAYLDGAIEIESPVKPERLAADEEPTEEPAEQENPS